MSAALVHDDRSRKRTRHRYAQLLKTAAVDNYVTIAGDINTPTNCKSPQTHSSTAGTPVGELCRRIDGKWLCRFQIIFLFCRMYEYVRVCLHFFLGQTFRTDSIFQKTNWKQSFLHQSNQQTSYIYIFDCETNLIENIKVCFLAHIFKQYAYHFYWKKVTNISNSVFDESICAS